MLGTFTIDDNIDDRIDRLNASLSIYRSEYSFARHEITNKTSVASFFFLSLRVGQMCLPLILTAASRVAKTHMETTH